ncbi:DUF1178 family protein [Novosphingobium sp. 9]|uniref:DUF1178 family protein n=1 Tax=Novosphingobium sp. 9 TaxID=2025349 RepID=UPI0021B6075E|nr:DUF1178 family protein [Novosphingobium sp. 9]
MIVYDLQCAGGDHRFEGWFKSSGDFEDQQVKGLIFCPHCDCSDIGKAVQAPRLTRKGNQLPQHAEAPAKASKQAAVSAAPSPQAPPPGPEQLAAVLMHLATVQAEVLKSSRHVGKHFVKEARAMHYGEQDAEAIHGEASLADARALAEEGIDLAPLLFPLTPEKAN